MRIKRLPEWVYKTVRATVQGYTARANAITYGEVRGGVKCKYEHLNNVIDDALREVFDDPYVQNIFRKDIGQRIGWQFSSANVIYSCDAYKRSKRKAIYLIAKSLNLTA